MTGAWERRLVNRITSRDQVWISLADSRLTREQVEAVAAKYGRDVVRECADDTDRLLLIAVPGDHLRYSLRRIRPYDVMMLVPWVLAGLTFVAILVASVLGGDAAFLTSVVGIGLTLASLFASRLFPVSARVSMLAREFTGEPSVSVSVSQYGLSQKLIEQMATLYGYDCLGPVSVQEFPTLVFARRTA